eukprot:7659088-Pyramimonas_sp.AAC.1
MEPQWNLNGISAMRFLEPPTGAAILYHHVCVPVSSAPGTPRSRRAEPAASASRPVYGRERTLPSCSRPSRRFLLLFLILFRPPRPLSPLPRPPPLLFLPDPPPPPPPPPHPPEFV